MVDDESAIRALVTLALKNAGHSVLQAADGADALELLDGKVGEIDLVLTDIRMPRVGGLELGHHIATRQLRLPVLYMSADPPALLLACESSRGTPACLQKPFSMDTLVAIVEGLLCREPGAPARCPVPARCGAESALQLRPPLLHAE